MIALRFFPSGSFQAVFGNTLNVSQSSVSHVVRDVAETLSKRSLQYIKVPTTAAEQITTKQRFFEVASFPNVLGAVDGTPGDKGQTV